MDAEMFNDDIFNMFGGGGGFGGLLGGFGGMPGRRARAPRGENTVHKLKVSLEELYSGKVAKLQLSKNTICTDCGGLGGHGTLNQCRQCSGRGIQITVNQIGPGMVQQMQSRCSACNGDGEIMAAEDKCKTCTGRKVVNQTKILEVNVEPGMRDEQRIVFRGEGDQLPGVEPGDVYIVLHEKAHPDFKRDGHDLILQKTVTLTEALCGFQTTVNHLDGRTLLLTHLPGEVLKPNSIRGIIGEGMPIYQQQGERGDLYIQFKIEFPNNYFTDEDKFTELEQLLGGRPEPEEIIPDDAEDVNLSEYDGKSKANDDDDSHGHGHGMHEPQVQCAHQ